MFAAYRNFPKVLSLLLGAGADAAMANDNGDAAISLAAGCGNASECVALLLGVPFPPSPGNSPDINTSTTGNSISSKSDKSGGKTKTSKTSAKTTNMMGTASRKCSPNARDGPLATAST